MRILLTEIKLTLANFKNRHRTYLYKWLHDTDQYNIIIKLVLFQILK